MSIKETPIRRDLNHPATIERVRKRIDTVAKADSLDDLEHDFSVAQGWMGALHVEGLLDQEQYELLDAELEQTKDAWLDAQG